MCALSRGRDVARREVAQAAVHQLRAEPAGSESEVIRFDQRHAEAARCGIERDSRTGDATSHDENVGALIGRECEIDPPSRDVERG